MKKLLLLLIGINLILSCGGQAGSTLEVGTQIQNANNQSNKETLLRIVGIDKNDFTVIQRSDTLIYQQELYEGIDGKRLEYNPSDFKSISAKIKYDFGFIQYTIDDDPATTLKFTKSSEWFELEDKNGLIEIPDFYGNTDFVRTYEVLGYESNEQIVRWIELENFETIKEESLLEQTNFYTQLLKKESTYESCCPEYISQAKAFLQSKEKEKQTLNDLNLELIYKSFTIEIVGLQTNGIRFRKVIIDQKP